MFNGILLCVHNMLLDIYVIYCTLSMTRKIFWKLLCSQRTLYWKYSTECLRYVWILNNVLIDICIQRDDSNELNHSIVVNCAEILLTLLETSTEMMCPSHLYGENACEGWAGGAPGGEGNQMDMSQVYFRKKTIK